MVEKKRGCRAEFVAAQFHSSHFAAAVEEFIHFHQEPAGASAETCRLELAVSG
jgi:hypothetical protein